MSRKRGGYKWTKAEEQALIKMFHEGRQYDYMAKQLNRSWFACKCRLIKLQLIPFSEEDTQYSLLSSVEKYDIPLKKCLKMDTFDVYEIKENNSRTFSNDEIDIVISYFKSSLAKLVIQKLDTVCFRRTVDITTLETVFKDEIGKLKNIKLMSMEDRERVLTKIS